MNRLRAALLPLLAVAALPLSGCYGSVYARPGYVVSRPAYGPVYRPAYQPVYRPVYYGHPGYGNSGTVVVQTQPGVTVVQPQPYQAHWVEGHYVRDGYGNTVWAGGHWE